VSLWHWDSPAVCVGTVTGLLTSQLHATHAETPRVIR
jgi:hypothetical protein